MWLFLGAGGEGFGRLTRLHCWISCPALQTLYKRFLPHSRGGLQRLVSLLSDLMTVIFFFFCPPPILPSSPHLSSTSPHPPGIYSSLKDPLSMGAGGVCSAPLGGGVCSTSLSLGGGMCSTPLSSGLLQSHVSSLSLPSVNAVSNTQVQSPDTWPRRSQIAVRPSGFRLLNPNMKRMRSVN